VLHKNIEHLLTHHVHMNVHTEPRMQKYKIFSFDMAQRIVTLYAT